MKTEFLKLSLNEYIKHINSAKEENLAPEWRRTLQFGVEISCCRI